MSTGLFLDKYDKNMLVAIFVVVTILTTDTMISQVADYLAPQLISSTSIILFCIFCIAGGITQYFILQYAKRKIRYQYSKSSPTRRMHKVVTVIQYSLFAVVLYLIFQILYSSSYSSYLLVGLTVGSYFLGTGLMSYFAYKFLSWYLSNKNSLIVLLYSISFSLIALASSLAVTGDLYNFASKPTTVFPTSVVEFPSNEEGTIPFFLNTIYHYLDLFSFVFVWGATVLLLHEYIRRWRLRHWILVSFPLVYFLSTFVDFVGIYTPATDSEWITYYIYASLNSTAGGLLFGFAFLIVARYIHNNTVKGYIIITAYGFVLLFISNQVTLVASSFPPFGAATITYFGLSSYLALIGLYTAALSVSQDASLRKSIKKSVIDKSKLLGSIGHAEMQQEIEKWVRVVDRTDNEINIPGSMTEDDIRIYIQDILYKVRKKTH